jgi:hypothetical protein
MKHAYNVQPYGKYVEKEVTCAPKPTNIGFKE